MIDALAELIWNGLDTERDRVDVVIGCSSLGTTNRDTYYVTRIEVRAHGHGITSEIAKRSHLWG